MLHRDPTFAAHEDIDDLPVRIVERISHFLQQTALDGSTEIGLPFGAERAGEVLQAAFADYRARYE
jgi:inorganic pyrophosphatase